MRDKKLKGDIPQRYVGTALASSPVVTFAFQLFFPVPFKLKDSPPFFWRSNARQAADNELKRNRQQSSFIAKSKDAADRHHAGLQERPAQLVRWALPPTSFFFFFRLFLPVNKIANAGPVSHMKSVWYCRYATPFEKSSVMYTVDKLRDTDNGPSVDRRPRGCGGSGSAYSIERRVYRFDEIPFSRRPAITDSDVPTIFLLTGQDLLQFKEIAPKNQCALTYDQTIRVCAVRRHQPYMD